MKHRCVTLTLKDLKSHIQSQYWGKKDDLLPVSKDCLQQGTKSEEEADKAILCSQKTFPSTL